VYSHSKLSCYEQCPQKYKLQYIDKVETEIEESVEAFMGVRVHETLEKLYRDLMAYWDEVLPGFMYPLNYEELVADQETQTRRLLEFCGLPWETQCLDFHRQKGSVATASATQVRQPIYSDAINRWRRYGDALRPLYDLLTSAGCLPPAGD